MFRAFRQADNYLKEKKQLISCHEINSKNPILKPKYLVHQQKKNVRKRERNITVILFQNYFR